MKVIYKVWYRDYKMKSRELLGTLPERRDNLRGKTQNESAMRWARKVFSQLVKDCNAIFVTVEEV